jgi:glycoprotein endo-alpha-1,2-mannosidase
MATTTQQHLPARGRARRRALAVALVATVLVSVAATTEAEAGRRKGGRVAAVTERGTTKLGRPSKSTSTSTTTTAPPTTTTTAPSPAPELAPGVLRRAALRITIDTSSDWAQVDLPGISAGHLVVATGGTSEVIPLASGVVVRGAAGVARSVSVDVVTELPRTLATGWVTLQQGALGATSVTIVNRTADPFRVLSISGRSGSPTSVEVATDTLMGPTQLTWKRADAVRRVLAFTYPWFDESAATDPRLSVHPSEPWRSWDPDDALRASRRARESGIDGFVMSWAGAASNGLALYQTLAAAEATSGTATILLETAAAGSAAVAERWLAEALEQSSSPAFLRLGGVPVVFVFDGGRLSQTEWRQIADRLAAAGTPVRLVSDAWAGAGGVSTGMYRYSALFQSDTDVMTEAELTEWNQTISRELRARATLGSGDPGLVVATVQPGWDDERLVVDRAGTATYDSTWSAALAGEPDWTVITSWNEWFEGTGIAPSVEYGTTGLTATAAWAQQFRR